MQTKDGYLMVGAAGEAIWARCAKAFGYPEWCEAPRFASNQARMANREALEAVMNAVLTTKTTNDWVEVLEAAGVPCGPAYDYAQMFADPQVRHRGLVLYASDAEFGEVPRIRTPIRIGKGVVVRNVAPDSAGTNAEIFGRLGVNEADLRELRAREYYDVFRRVVLPRLVAQYCPSDTRIKEVPMSQTISIERVDHVGIRVRDLDRALNFYRALGFSLLHRSDNDDVAIIRNENSVELNLIFNAKCA